MLDIIDTGEMARKPKKTQNIGIRTTLENEQYIIGASHVAGITSSEYIHRLITSDRQKTEGNLKIMAKALGFNVNPVNKINEKPE